MAAEFLARAGADDIHPMAIVKDLSLSRRQMVEIAKALARRPKILILDEATSALTAADVTRVVAVLKRLRADGLAIVYISHRMHEIAALADDCTVFRNGRHVATFAANTKSDTETVEMMIGREYRNVFPPRRGVTATLNPALEIRKLCWAGRLHDIDLTIRPGEVVGIGGLDGQGQRDLLLALFGVLSGLSGDVKVDGAPVAVAESARGQTGGHRHGADPGGPQDRGADPGDVGARQPFAGGIGPIHARGRDRSRGGNGGNR